MDNGECNLPSQSTLRGMLEDPILYSPYQGTTLQWRLQWNSEIHRSISERGSDAE